MTTDEPSGTGVDLIAAERQRQIEQEGWTLEHDAEHADESIARAAACYAMPCRRRVMNHGRTRPIDWPVGWLWSPTPDDRVRELVKAGALIAAEIDRLSR